ncbi:MAG TPA: hypothetical protein VGN52_04625 [Burkholderiales bacterium]
MRTDMSKVIVERPRWSSGWVGSKEGRLYRDSEDVSSKQGMKRGYKDRRSLSENLNPLQRYIASQVNRPWNKVYSELCANIDRRNAVQEHIFQHMDQFVERHTRLIDGRVHVRGSRWSQEWRPLEESPVEMYVHPSTGLLLRNRYRKGHVAQVRSNRVKQALELTARRRILGDRQQLHCIDGLWYLVGLDTLPECKVTVVREEGKIREVVERQTRWDVFLKKPLSALDDAGRYSHAPMATYGRHGVYAVSKRQLSERELRRHGLKQKGRDSSRPFCLRRKPQYASSTSASPITPGSACTNRIFRLAVAAP